MDGIKIYLGEIGWLLVRASGTENLLRVYCETSNQEMTQRALDSVIELVRTL
jgi:phosphomannomutase